MQKNREYNKLFVYEEMENKLLWHVGDMPPEGTAEIWVNNARRLLAFHLAHG